MDAIKGRHCGYAGQLLVGGINSDYVAEATAVMMDGGPCPGMHVRPVAQRRWVTFELRNVNMDRTAVAVRVVLSLHAPLCRLCRRNRIRETPFGDTRNRCWFCEYCY